MRIVKVCMMPCVPSGKSGNILLRGRSHGRKVLKNIKEGKELCALQTDSYNMYLFLENWMQDIDHGYCMAHVMAKFKYAAEMEHDVNAHKFLEYIGRLYAREKGI